MKWDYVTLTKKHGKTAAYCIFLLAVSVGFVLLYSSSTSPLYPWYFGSDSAQFQTMGMAWANGRIPYRDIFDHKGPMAFFFDMLGFLIAGNGSGICIFQIVFMWIDLIAVSAIIGLYLRGTIPAIMGTGMFLIMYAMVYNEGNLGEEYCLPVVLIASYYQLKYLRSNEKQHAPKMAFLYGLGFGICLFSKATNALTLCVLTLVIAGNVLASKEYKNFGQNCLAFVLGTLAIALPFSIYFAIHGSFGAMMFSMIEFNISYQEKMPDWILNATSVEWNAFFLYFFPYYCSVITLVLSLRKREYRMAIYHVLILLMGGYLFFGGQLYNQYMIMMLPNVLILIGEIFSLSKEEGREDSTLIQMILLMMFCGIFIQVVPDLIGYPSNMMEHYSEKQVTDYDMLLNGVPEEERDSFVAFGAAGLKDIYLQNDIIPACKYFAIQSWHASLNEKTLEDIRDVYDTAPCTWLLTDLSADLIQDTLDDKYFFIASNGEYSLYHKNWDLY